MLVCWNTLTNTIYQIQYRSDLTTNLWTDLGDPIQGNGTINCITDSIALGEPQRFYQIVTKP